MPRAATLSRTVQPPAAALADDTPDVIGRIEAWVASYLDGLDAKNNLANLQDWQTHALEIFNPRAVRPNFKEKKIEAAAGWKRVSICRKHGATVIKLRDQILVKEGDLDEFNEELIDLIEAGHRRIVLDFGNVERLSCGILPMLADASRRCAEGGLGQLRLFNLQPDVAPVVGLCPLTRSLNVPADEASAIDGAWPGADVPRPLPEALLASLVPPRPSLRTAEPELEPEESDSMAPEFDAPLPAPALAYALVVQTGSTKGRPVPIGERGLTIGRDEKCKIRSQHASLSRRHAVIWARKGRVYIRDLGSTNGTLVNDQAMGLDDIRLRPGDRIQVGPLKFTITLDVANCTKAPNEDEIIHWLGADSEDTIPFASDEDTVYDVPSTTNPVRTQVIEDVLVVTPLDPQLLGGQDVSVFRDELAALLEAPAPHRVVVNLKLSSRLSNAAVGVLVAHHIRLDRLGGALRLAEPHVRVAEVLNQIRLPLILDVYASEDEAVLASWGR